MDPPTTLKYFVDKDEAQFDYGVEGDGSAILLRSKYDMPLFPNTMDVVEVSPVSDLAEIFILAAFLVIYAVMWLAYMCLDCCCSRCLMERLHRRRVEQLRRQRAEALARWNRPRENPVTLRSIASRSLIKHVKPPVKQNLRRMDLPRTIITELVELRRNESIAV